MGEGKGLLQVWQISLGSMSIQMLCSKYEQYIHKKLCLLYNLNGASLKRFFCFFCSFNGRFFYDFSTHTHPKITKLPIHVFLS